MASSSAWPVNTRPVSPGRSDRNLNFVQECCRKSEVRAVRVSAGCVFSFALNQAERVFLNERCQILKNEFWLEPPQRPLGEFL